MAKISEQVKIARKFKEEMAFLERQQDALYRKALRKLDWLDTTTAYEYFYNDQVGLNSFEESLKDAALQA